MSHLQQYTKIIKCLPCKLILVKCDQNYVPKSSTTFCGILICMIFRHRDMQEYILMFSIALEWRYLYCILIFADANLKIQYSYLLILYLPTMYVYCLCNKYGCLFVPSYVRLTCTYPERKV